MKGLKVADNLTLPLEAVTEKLAWLGRTGSGKTYGATKLAELMLDASVQIVALDPVGVWRGLRVPSAKGGDAMAIYVFGGLYHDFPLEPSGGRLMADIIADRGISVVLDVSQWVDTEQQRFARDFAEHFFSRKKAAPSAVHLFMEESQEFLPQNPQREEAKTLHHFTRLWKLGRNFGIGGSLISQRPQEVNKKALNMSGTLFAFQMTGPQERKTVEDWISAQGINEDIRDILPTLTVGQPHAWSAAFGFSKTVRILPKVTADVSSSPKVIGGRAKEQPLTPIDVEKLSKEMAATIEKAKAEDPRELRKTIADLRKELAGIKNIPVGMKGIPTPKRVDVLTDADRELLRKLDERLRDTVDAIADRADVTLTSIAERAKAEVDAVAARWVTAANVDRLKFLTALDQSRFQKILDKLVAVAPAPHQNVHRHWSTVAPSRRPEPATGSLGVSGNRPRPAPRMVAGDGAVTLSGGERKILTALAQYPDGRTKVQVALLTAYAHSGGGFNNYLSGLRSKGWLNGSGDLLRITDAGLAALGSYELLPSGPDLQAHWLRQLGKAERLILTTLIGAYPSTLSKEDIAARVGYEATGGGFNNALGRLRTLELVKGRAELVASEELFS